MAIKKILTKLFSSPSRNSGNQTPDEKLIKLLGFQPKNPELFHRALTHPTFNLKDDEGLPFNYERLEFLGDSVLSLIVSEYLFKLLPGADEGKLSELRSKVVSRKNLNHIGKKMNLQSFLPREHRKQYGENVEGNLLESLLGAIYLDQGFKVARDFVNDKIIRPFIKLDKIADQISSYKNEMVEWTQKNHKTYTFRHQTETNKEGQDIHFVELYIDDKLMGRGRASSKKKAEEMASKNAWKQLNR